MTYLEVVSWCQRHGRTRELVAAVCELRQTRTEAEFQQLREWLANNPPANPPAALGGAASG